ncbi:MAG: hypothetical protein Q4G60_10570 [bacterium]|nr:hypothetical protein [bacterium]
MKNYKCDKCGKEITQEDRSFKLAVVEINGDKGCNIVRSDVGELDFCEEHLQEVYEKVEATVFDYIGIQIADMKKEAAKTAGQPAG